MKKETRTEEKSSRTAPPMAGPPAGASVAIDGFEQVFEMLKIADIGFRESLLKRLASRDVELARTLRERLTAAGLS